METLDCTDAVANGTERDRSRNTVGTGVIKFLHAFEQLGKPDDGPKVLKTLKETWMMAALVTKNHNILYEVLSHVRVIVIGWMKMCIDRYMSLKDRTWGINTYGFKR